MKHFKDCPENQGYSICTCNMSGEMCALVDWQIKKQENILPWWAFVARLSTFNSPTIERNENVYT